MSTILGGPKPTPCFPGALRGYSRLRFWERYCQRVTAFCGSPWFCVNAIPVIKAELFIAAEAPLVKDWQRREKEVVFKARNTRRPPVQGCYYFALDSRKSSIWSFMDAMPLLFLTFNRGWKTCTLWVGCGVLRMGWGSLDGFLTVLIWWSPAVVDDQSKANRSPTRRWE